MQQSTFRLKGVTFAVMLGLGVTAIHATAETLCAAGSGAVRADLRTGEWRHVVTAAPLPYSTEWDGGATATIADNGETAFQGSGSGTYAWTPTAGLHELTHTVVVGGTEVVLTARFRVGETLIAAGSGAVRADLRTGEWRHVVTAEPLPYSTEWDGGDTATITDNGETAFQGSGSGTYAWLPAAGLHELTHTVVTDGGEVVLTAKFRVGETLVASGSGAVRADLCTGEVRTAYPTEMLTYSTEWDGGDAVTIADNGSKKFQDSGSGLMAWTPQYAGTHLLTHTVVTNGVPVVLTATFEVQPSQNVPVAWWIGATDDDSVVAWTNSTGTLVIEGSGQMMSFASDGTDVPWPQDEVAAVTVDPSVTQIGTNAWYGLGEGVAYTVYAPAAKSLNVGFGGVDPQLGYARTAFKAIQSADGVVSLAVALETTPSLTNEWTEVTLEKDEVTVDDNGRIVIEHQTGNQQQGFYTIQSAE